MATDRKIKNQGMNWISQHKRLAIYLRDGLACAYCGSNIEDGVQLTLDHIHPHSLGGTNHESNLITCCQKCNSSRGNRNVVVFADIVANYVNHGLKGSDILTHIANCVSRKLDTKVAKELVERRGSCFQVLQNGGK